MLLCNVCWGKAFRSYGFSHFPNHHTFRDHSAATSTCFHELMAAADHNFWTKQRNSSFLCGWDDDLIQFSHFTLPFASHFSNSLVGHRTHLAPMAATGVYNFPIISARAAFMPRISKQVAHIRRNLSSSPCLFRCKIPGTVTHGWEPLTATSGQNIHYHQVEIVLHTKVPFQVKLWSWSL